MKKIPVLIILLAALMTNIVLADNFEEAARLIQSSVPCSSLADDQLEIIGDYYMEQMHPGNLHEIMDERMGGEGSATLRQVHINIAKSFYCGQSGSMPANMMNVMMNRAGGGIMGYNMMGFNMMGYSPGFGYGYSTFGWLIMIAFWIAVIWLIVWAIKQFTSGKESSHEILEKRLAKGEISKKEYLELKSTLRRK